MTTSLDLQQIRQRIITAQPELAGASVSDWQKVELLRGWAYEHTNWASTSLLLDHDGKELQDLLGPLLSEEAGVWCGGAARVLQLLYQEFGFESYALNVGRDDLGSHVCTLVRIQHDGEHRLVLEDAYINESYLDEDGQPLDYFRLIEKLTSRQHSSVKVIQHAGTKLLLQDPADQRYGCSKYCEPLARLPSGIEKYRFKLTADYLEWGFGLETRAALGRAGYPPSLLYLHLFPLGICCGTAADTVLARARELLGTAG